MKGVTRSTNRSPEPSGIARLVAAERVWAERLAQARVRAEAIVSAAREDARFESDRAGDVSSLVGERQTELAAHRDGQLQAARDELRQRRECYAAVSEETIARLAREITDSMPWFAPWVESS